MKNNSAHSLALAAAFAGLLGGTTARLHAQPIEQSSTTSASSQAGVLLIAQSSTPDTTKHSCKGKNDCKGQGGGKDPARTLARVKAAAPPTVANLPRLPLLPRRPSTDLCWRLEIAQASNVSVCLTAGAYDASQSIQRIY